MVSSLQLFSRVWLIASFNKHSILLIYWRAILLRAREKLFRPSHFALYGFVDNYDYRSVAQQTIKFGQFYEKK